MTPNQLIATLGAVCSDLQAVLSNGGGSRAIEAARVEVETVLAAVRAYEISVYEAEEEAAAQC